MQQRLTTFALITSVLVLALWLPSKAAANKLELFAFCVESEWVKTILASPENSIDETTLFTLIRESDHDELLAMAKRVQVQLAGGLDEQFVRKALFFELVEEHPTWYVASHFECLNEHIFPAE